MNRIGIFIGGQAILANEGAPVNYWRPVGLGLLVLGALLAVYGLTEYLRMASAPCAWPSLCLAPDSALYYLIIPGVAMAICGVIVLLTAPKKVRPISLP